MVFAYDVLLFRIIEVSTCRSARNRLQLMSERTLFDGDGRGARDFQKNARTLIASQYLPKTSNCSGGGGGGVQLTRCQVFVFYM